MWFRETFEGHFEGDTCLERGPAADKWDIIFLWGLNEAIRCLKGINIQNGTEPKAHFKVLWCRTEEDVEVSEWEEWNRAKSIYKLKFFFLGGVGLDGWGGRWGREGGVQQLLDNKRLSCLSVVFHQINQLLFCFFIILSIRSALIQSHRCTNQLLWLLMSSTVYYSK